MTRFQIKCYAREAVVFDTASGDTHYLTPLAYALYTSSRDQPGISREELATSLALHFEVDPDAHFRQLADQAMFGLEAIGLLHAP